MPVLRNVENAPDVRQAHQVAASREPPGCAEIGGGMTPLEILIRQASEVIERLGRERDEARALAKLWRDLYEWDYDGPLPTYHFPWEKKP